MQNILLIFLLLSSPLSFGITSLDPDPVIAEFGKGLSRKNIHCWDENNVLKKDACRTIDVPCSLSKTFQGENRLNLQFSFPGEKIPLNLLRSDLRDPGETFKTFNVWSHSIDLNQITANSRFVIFKNDHNRFTIFMDEVASGDKKYSFSLKQPFKKIKFIAEEGWLFSNVQRINGYLWGSPIGILTGPENYIGLPGNGQVEAKVPEIVLPAGEFEVRFSYRNEDSEIFENVFKIKVSEGDLQESVVVIRKSDFIIKSRKFDLRFEKNKYSLDPFKSYLVDRGFLEMPEITLVEKNLSLNSMFTYLRGEIIVKPDTPEKIKKLVEGLSSYEIKFQGKCSEIFDYRVIEDYAVHSKADEKSTKLGNLKLLKDQNLENMKYFDDKTGAIHPFIPSIHNGTCNDTEIYFYHHVKQISGSWLNLGEGSWGPEGWVQAKYFKLYEDKSKNDFKWGENAWVNFSKKGKKVIVRGNRNFADENGDLGTEKVNEEIQEQELFDKDGRLKIKVNCNYGC